MFGSLISGKFSNKCKHSVKCIKCRMETIRKKNQAIVRYLKKDVADLISCGHDRNAYGRMDALIVEINKLSCYDMIEQYCCCILEHLQTMQKDRVCPSETTEAIATLIFAAARFSDLPELTDLRHQFTARYGTPMEAYINKEFVEKMQKKSFSDDKKLQLMQDIAQDFSIHWDVNTFQCKKLNPSAPTHDRGTANGANDMQKGRLNSEKLVYSEVNNEGQKSIQMERHRSRNAVLKEVAADVLENAQSPQFDKIVPVNVKANENQNGNQTKGWNSGRNTRKTSESVREKIGSVGIERQGAAASMFTGDSRAVDITTPFRTFSGGSNVTSTSSDDFAQPTTYNVQENRPTLRVNLENNRPFNPKPPYVKSKVTKSPTDAGSFEPTKHEMCHDKAVDVAVHPKNAPFSVRSKRKEQTTATISESPIDNRQIFMSRLSKKTEDNDINGGIHRAFNDEPRYGCSRSLEKHDEEDTLGNPLMYYSNRKGRARMIEPSAQSTLDSTPITDPNCTPETMIKRSNRVSSKLQDKLNSYGARTLPDHDDLAARLAALKKL